VQCSKDQAQACEQSGTQYVCDPQSHACDLTRKAHSKDACNICVDSQDDGCKSHPDCISDDECQVGQACVDVPAGAGTLVCQQVFTDATVCQRPYFGSTNAPVPSADGPDVTVCTFRTATTCQAHADYSNKRCGTPLASDPNQDQPNSADNTKCGAPGIDDGYCVWFPSQHQYLCTVPCNNNVGDCPAFNTKATCDQVTTQLALCSL
jgi:hypothetical protein